jgi:hypothetical protein
MLGAASADSSWAVERHEEKGSRSWRVRRAAYPVRSCSRLARIHDAAKCVAIPSSVRRLSPSRRIYTLRDYQKGDRPLGSGRKILLRWLHQVIGPTSHADAKQSRA